MQSIYQHRRLILKAVGSAFMALIAFFGSYALGLLGGALAGAGHGSGILGFLFLSPVFHVDKDSYVICGPYIWACLFALLPWYSRLPIKVLSILMILIADSGVFMNIANDIRQSDTVSYAFVLFRKVPEIAFPLVGAYVVMQSALLWRIFSAKT